MPIVIEVPNRGRIELPDGTPEAEIDSIVSKEFPPTGEDIAQRLAEDPTFRLDDQQFAEFEKYSKAKQTDWVNAIASGVDSLVQTATTAAVEGVKGAALNPANYLEGFGQGTRQLYGFAAQSQDPGSPMFRFKDLIAGTGTLQSRREQFNQARDFNEQSIKYESGQETMLPKELVNPEFAQGVSLVADPTMLIPGLGQVLGAEKLVAKAIGKGAQVAGRTIKGPAGLINRAVSVAESALTQTAGMSPEAFRAGLSTTGVLGVAGVADPTAGLIASVPVAARTAAGFGAGLEEVGTGLLRAPSRIGALESLGMTPDASLARRAIGFAGRFGGDTALNTGIAATAGAAEGALVGGGMGYLSGGEEGAAVGIGSGLAAGAPGAVLGRVYQGMTGQLARDARVNDLARYVSTLSDNKRSVYESVQKRFGTDVAANLMDLEALVRGKRNDISVDLLNESDFKTATGGVIARGIVPDENSPTPRILVNVDALSKGTGDNPIYTLGHELVHALGTSKQFQGDLAGITERLTGTYVPNPDGTFKLVEAGQYTPAKVEELFNQYLSKLPEGVRQQVLTDNPTAADRANYVGEELVAEQVGRILSSQKPDAFLRNFGTLKSDFTDWLIVKEAYEKVSKVGQWIEGKFGVKPSDSILFPQIKETSPVLDATLRQLLRARTNLDEAINRADFKKTFSINAKNISDPTVADLAIKGGFAVRNADGTVRLLTNGELFQRDTQDVILARETLGRVPGAKMDINGSLDKAPTPEQVAAINASTGISSHMKERFAMASQSIADGRSIFGEYYPATERVKDTSSNRWRVKYAPRKVTLRDTLPYNLLFSKENNAYIRGIDITKIRSEIQKHVRAGGVAGLWPDVGSFMSDLAAYFTNRDRGEAGLPTRELLGPDKAKFMGDFLNRFEKGGSEFVHSFRLDRFGEMRPGDFRARFSETGYKGMKDRLMPAGQVGDTESFKSESGYTVLAKNNKFRLYGPGGELLGIYDSPQQAERKINATETRLQSKIDQQQRPARNEVRQTSEAGGRNRPVSRTQGGEEGGQALGQVRQEGDVVGNFDALVASAPEVRFMPIESQPENAPVSGRLSDGQRASIDELSSYYTQKTPERVKVLRAEAVDSLASRLVNKGVPVQDANAIASKTFSKIRKGVSGALQVISGMGLSDLSRMAGTGKPTVERRPHINPNWLTSAFEAFATDEGLALMKAQQVATQLNKAEQAKVAAGESVEAAKASGIRQSTMQQGMEFVLGEMNADRKAFGSSLREDLNSPPRVYASVLEGQKFGSQGNYNVFFEWKTQTPMVVTSHHHYGVANGVTGIHAQGNVGDKNARSFGNPSNERFDTLPSGKQVLDTHLLVGNEGVPDARAHQLTVSIPESALANIRKAYKERGVSGVDAELNKIAVSQMVGSASQGKTFSYTTKEGIPPMVAIQRNRTEAYVLDPDLSNVGAVTIVSNSPKEVALIKKNLQKAFENNGSQMPKVKVVSAESGASKNPGRKAITDEYFKLTGQPRFMPSSLTARDINAIAAEVGGGDVKGGAKAFGAFMRLMRDKGITLRDVIKSYGITLSSIQRQELPVSTIKKNWPDAPFEEGTKVRPEDAFAQLLGTPEGQRYLDAAENGVFDDQAADAVVQKFRSFGFHNKLKEQMKTAVEQFYPKAQEIIDAVNTMPTDRFIDYVRNNFKGISYGKVGFWSGQLGRGDIPTFDSRQGKLVYGKEVPVTKQVLMEQKDRLTQLGIKVPAAFKDFAQTLLHHEVWDRLNQSDTEHGPIKEAMLRYMPQPDPSVPGAYSVTGGFRILPGKTKGRLRVYGPSGSLLGIAGSLDEAQRMIRKQTKTN